MNFIQCIGASLLLTAAGVVQAQPCEVSIQANEQMQFSSKELTVPASCADVELTLKNTGSQPVNVMGHDWVLARDTDVPGLVEAGQAAGAANGYVPQNDKRVIAATKLVGPGESASVTFKTSALQPHTHYDFFCTFPGHAATMRGHFVLK